MTESEMNQIAIKAADIAVEEILTRMPEVIGNLMAHHAMLNKTNKAFYDKHKEFVEHKDMVAAVLEQMEGLHPEKKYEELLEMSVPEITQKLGTIDKLDTKHATANLDMNAPAGLKPNGFI